MRIRVLFAVAIVFVGTLVGAYFLFGPSGAWFKIAAEVRGKEREADARTKLAFASLVDRLPKGKPFSLMKPLAAAAAERWEHLDRGLASEQDRRAELLAALHERSRKFFIESPGAGSGRIKGESIEDILFDR